VIVPALVRLEANDDETLLVDVACGFLMLVRRAAVLLGLKNLETSLRQLHPTKSVIVNLPASRQRQVSAPSRHVRAAEDHIKLGLEIKRKSRSTKLFPRTPRNMIEVVHSIGRAACTEPTSR